MNFMLPALSGQNLAQRAAGKLSLRFALANHGATPGQASTRVVEFFQEGCLKARLPRPQVPDICELVTLNISGGIAGADQLHAEITLNQNAKLCMAAQSAEKIYRADGSAPAEITHAMHIGPGARMEYLPQETIVFNGFALRRTLAVNLAADAVFLGVESLIFGRKARGEAITSGWLRDEIILRQNGAVILHDLTRLHGNIAACLARQAVAGGHIAMACILYAAPDALALLPAIRAALQNTSGHAGASVVNNVARVRILAPDAATLRACVVSVLNICRNGRALPRVWQS